LRAAIEQAYGEGLKLWGTCAGAILLARENVGEAPFFGLIDITVNRNAFGSQLDSFQCEALAPAVAREPIPLTFIRAPKIVRIGSDVQALLQTDDYVAAAEDDADSGDGVPSGTDAEPGLSSLFRPQMRLECGRGG
jgi:5'-phosphate synthase pdxT subunit